MAAEKEAGLECIDQMGRRVKFKFVLPFAVCELESWGLGVRVLGLGGVRDKEPSPGSACLVFTPA